jgi:hypothetical protein
VDCSRLWTPGLAERGPLKPPPSPPPVRPRSAVPRGATFNEGGAYNTSRSGTGQGESFRHRAWSGYCLQQRSQNRIPVAQPTHMRGPLDAERRYDYSKPILDARMNYVPRPLSLRASRRWSRAAYESDCGLSRPFPSSPDFVRSRHFFRRPAISFSKPWLVGS